MSGVLLWLIMIWDSIWLLYDLPSRTLVGLNVTTTFLWAISWIWLTIVLHLCLQSVIYAIWRLKLVWKRVTGLSKWKEVWKAWSILRGVKTLQAHYFQRQKFKVWKTSGLRFEKNNITKSHNLVDSLPVISYSSVDAIAVRRPKSSRFQILSKNSPIYK